MIKQWAAGLSETLALGLINEAIGLGIPLVTVPWVSGPLLRHPALAASMSRLRQAGVRVLESDPGPEGGEIPPGHGCWTVLVEPLVSALEALGRPLRDWDGVDQEIAGHSPG
jgi:hypothetical protein